MSNRDSDFWMRELARTGMSPKAQKDFLASLSNAVDTRARYFPADPVVYVERVRSFIMHAFLPQMGPLLLSVDPSYPPRTHIAEPMLANCAPGTVVIGWALPPCGRITYRHLGHCDHFDSQ